MTIKINETLPNLSLLTKKIAADCITVAQQRQINKYSSDAFPKTVKLFQSGNPEILPFKCLNKSSTFLPSFSQVFKSFRESNLEFEIPQRSLRTKNCFPVLKEG